MLVARKRSPEKSTHSADKSTVVGRFLESKGNIRLFAPTIWSSIDRNDLVIGIMEIIQVFSRIWWLPIKLFDFDLLRHVYKHLYELKTRMQKHSTITFKAFAISILLSTVSDSQFLAWFQQMHSSRKLNGICASISDRWKNTKVNSIKIQHFSYWLGYIWIWDILTDEKRGLFIRKNIAIQQKKVSTLFIRCSIFHLLFGITFYPFSIRWKMMHKII